MWWMCLPPERCRRISASRSWMTMSLRKQEISARYCGFAPTRTRRPNSQVSIEESDQARNGSRLFSFQAKLPKEEGHDVRPLLHLDRDWLARAVARLWLDAQQNRSVGTICRRRLQKSRHLARVQRIDTGIAFGRKDQCRRVACFVFDVLVGRVFGDERILLRTLGSAVFGD